MIRFLTALTLGCFLTTTSFADSKNYEYKIHVIYAGDQSGSMRKGHPAWLYIQQFYLTQYFSEFSGRCQEIHFDYVGWGTDALPPLRTVLRTNADGKELSGLLYQLTYQNLEATVQDKGMLKALSLIDTENYDRTIVIFVSDEYIANEDGAELWKLVPADVELIGISLGSDSVYGYFMRHIVPPTANGKHYHASTKSEFGQILYEVFDGLGFDHCPAT